MNQTTKADAGTSRPGAREPGKETGKDGLKQPGTRTPSATGQPQPSDQGQPKAEQKDEKKKDEKEKTKKDEMKKDDGPLIVLLVESPHPALVRTHVYTVPRGRHWEEWPVKPSVVAGNNGRFHLRPVRVREPLLQRYEVAAPLSQRIPAVYRPEHLGFPALAIGLGLDWALHAGERLQPGARYAVLSMVEYVGERPTGGIERDPEMRSYGWLSRDLRTAVAQEAWRQAGRLAAPREKAAALEAYLRRGFQLGLFEAGDSDPTSAFLFEQKRGTSEQFASAMALMLRASDIPSRVVEGYRMRRYNPLRGRYEIWKSDRHLWVEAFVDSRWTVYEPSPWATLPPRDYDQSSWESAQEYVRLARINDAGEPLLPPDRPGDGYLWLVLAWGWVATFGPWILLSLVCAALLAWRYRRWLRPLLDAMDRARLSRAGGGRERVLAAYRIVESVLARRELQRAPAETHAEYFARVVAARPQLRAPLAQLGAGFAVARYAQSPPETAAADGAAQACREVLELVDELSAR